MGGGVTVEDTSVVMDGPAAAPTPDATPGPELGLGPEPGPDAAPTPEDEAGPGPKPVRELPVPASVTGTGHNVVETGSTSVVTEPRAGQLVTSGAHEVMV